jgi:hypothetical protein
VKVWLDRESTSVDSFDDRRGSRCSNQTFTGPAKFDHWRLEKPAPEAAYAVENQAGS